VLGAGQGSDCYHGLAVQGPLVSIVTPSFNSGEFLQRPSRACWRRDYPNVEYLVMDGGSPMGRWRSWSATAGACSMSRSRTGRGRRHQSRLPAVAGRILAWLGADDLYLPGAIASAVEAFAAAPGAAVVYGERALDRRERQATGPLSHGFAIHAGDVPARVRRLQPACFLRRRRGAGGAAGRVAGVGFRLRLVDPALAAA